MRYIVTINNKEYEVEVEKGKAAVVGMKTVVPAANAVAQAVQAPVAAPAPTAPAASPAPAPIAPGSGELVKAPMPGTILDVKAAAGTKVKKGQVILILEAMKMENEIVAPIDGTVAQIQAAKGSSVNTGDILAVIQ
jgi:biotin carboxyl carrier protein